jgi:hypothetical protein
MPNRFYIPDKTWNLDKKSNFDKFIQSYIKMLQKEFKKLEVKGSNYTYSYYTCGQIHDSRNPAWEPYRILWQLCKTNGYDPFIAKEIIEDHIGRKLTCECQLLNGDEKEIRRMTLQNIFGADFGCPGRRDFDII